MRAKLLLINYERQDLMINFVLEPGLKVHNCFVVIQREINIFRFVHEHVIIWFFFILHAFELTFVPLLYDLFNFHILSHKYYFDIFWVR
jgi:hypothetical protein